MSTPYTELYPLIRAAVGDRGVRDGNGDLKPNTFDYADDDIAPVITLALLEIPDFSGDGTDITPTISTDDEKGLICFLSALYLALPNGPYSLEVPNMRYVQGANENLVANLYGKYKMYLESGGDATYISGTYNLLFNAGQLVSNRVQEVVNEV
jgi:hypothetical protein